MTLSLNPFAQIYHSYKSSFKRPPPPSEKKTPLEIATDHIACPRIFKNIPIDIENVILNYLPLKELGVISRINKSAFKIIKENPLVKKKQLEFIRRFAYGRETWKRCFNVDVGIEPDFKANTFSILQKNLAANTKLYQSFFLVLLPEHINNEPYTLNKLGDLTSKIFPDSKNGFWAIDYMIKNQIGNIANKKSRWVFISKGPLVDSYGEKYEFQAKLLEGLSTKIQVPFREPSILEVSTLVYIHYIATSERFYSKTATYCKERIEIKGKKTSYPTTIGYFTIPGVYIALFKYKSTKSLGMAAAYDGIDQDN